MGNTFSLMTRISTGAPVLIKHANLQRMVIITKVKLTRQELLDKKIKDAMPKR